MRQLGVFTLALGLLTAVPGCRSTGLGRAGRRRRVQSSNSSSSSSSSSKADVEYVRKEAFDAQGRSLGLVEDASESWKETTVVQPEVGEPPYMYNVNAASYLVGESDSLIVEFWHPFDEDFGGKDMAAVHLNVARLMVLEHRENGTDKLSVRVVNKGWTGVVNDEMCVEGSSSIPCPALVLAGTTQMAARYDKGNTLALNDYLADWAVKQGWILTDDFIKYYFYDFNYDGKWQAVPLVSDTRVLAYNKTTFDSLNMTYPPGVTEERWEWPDFVQAAKNITEGIEREGLSEVPRPGWYFKGSWDEELKLTLMIARNWGSTLYKEDQQLRKSCALGEGFELAMEETIKKMFDEGWMSDDFVITNSTNFENWLADDTLPVDMDPELIPNATDPNFSVNSSELWGMSIVSPGTLKDILDPDMDPDIGEALVPGLFSFLGGSGLFLTNSRDEEQQDLGWDLLTLMIERVSTYALVQRSPPPLESALEREETWSLPEWQVHVEQLRSAVPAQYPNPGFSEFQSVEESKPFRLMWMEMNYKKYTVQRAAERVNASVNALLGTVCTEEDHVHESCRECGEDDYAYAYEVLDCNPRTQRHEVVFRLNGTLECFGVQIPDSESFSCVHVEVTSRFGIAIITVSCLGGLLAIMSAGLVYAYRRRPVIKFSQPRFCVLFSLGVAGMCLSNLALVGPNTKGSCVARVSVWGIAFDLAFGALFSKVYRVRRVLSQGRGRRQRTRRSFLPLVSVVSLAVVVDVLVLAMWSLLDDHGPSEVEVKVPSSDIPTQVNKCASEGGGWAIVFISFKIVLIAWGCYLAWVTRKINHALVEGKEISWSIYLFAVLGIMLIVIGSANLRVEYWALAKAFVYSLSSCTALVMVLVPKLWGAHKNVLVNVHQLTADATAMRGGSTVSIGNSNDLSNDSDPTDHGGAHYIFRCSHCSTPFDATNHIRQVKGIHAPPPLLAPRAGAPRGGTAVVGGWQGVVPTRVGMQGDSTDPNNYNATRHQGATSNVAVGACSGVEDSFLMSPVGLPSKKRNAGMAALVGTAGGDKAGNVAGQREHSKLPPVAPSHGGGGVFRETEVGLALKLSKVERGFRRSPASSTGGIPSIGGRPPSSGLSNSSRGLGRLRANGTGATRKKGSWRGAWKRHSKEDSMLSLSPHSELDAASFSRSLQAQAAAMRAALWSSTHTSQQSENETVAKKMSNLGKGGSFGRRAAAVTPAKGTRSRTNAAPGSATPGSMRAALNAGRIAATTDTDGASAVGAPPGPIVATSGTGNGSLSVTTNPLHVGATGGGGSATGAGPRVGTDGRPPAHRVPALRLDSPGVDDNNPLVTPPPGRYLLQPWVGGTRPARSARRGPGPIESAFTLRPARIDSHATTSQVSPGMSSAASYSPPTTGEPIVFRQNVNTISSISPASATSATDGFGVRWGEESKMAEPVDTQSVFSSNGLGAAKTRKLVPTPSSSSRKKDKALQRGASALWGSIDKCDSPPRTFPLPPIPTSTVSYDSPGMGMGAAKTRKLVETPVSVHRARKDGGVQVSGVGCSSCLHTGMPVGIGHRQKVAAALVGAATAPASDTLDDTQERKAQWVREAGGNLV